MVFIPISGLEQQIGKTRLLTDILSFNIDHTTTNDKA